MAGQPLHVHCLHHTVDYSNVEAVENKLLKGYDLPRETGCELFYVS